MQRSLLKVLEQEENCFLSIFLINFGSGNPEAGMLDLRRRMGMDPWNRREKSAGKQDIQVFYQTSM